MKKGANPQDIRIKNLLIIIQLLREQSLSGTKLASLTSLSLTAVLHIVNELIEKKLICSNILYTQFKGRPAVNYSINPNFGVAALIELTSTVYKNYYTISLCDFEGKLLTQQKIDPLIGNADLLTKNIINALDSLISKLSQKNQLLRISIAAPGLIDKSTGNLIITALQENDGPYNIKQILENYYNVDVDIYNLLYLALYSEKHGGKLALHNNFVMQVNIDEGIGLGIAINDIIYEGANGFLGELGFITNNITYGDQLTLQERLQQGLSSTISMKALRAEVETSFGAAKDSISLIQIVNLFNENNPTVVDLVQKNAHKVASFLKNLVMLFDIEAVVISGLVTEFGDFYKKLLIDNINSCYPTKVSIYFSSLLKSVSKGLTDITINKTIYDIISKKQV